MKHMRILHRFWMMLGLYAVGVVSIGILLIFVLRDSVFEGRQQDVRSAVSIGYSLIEYYSGLEQSGSLSRAEAQEAAKAAIRTIRYEGSEYLWINDYDARMVMHPIKPELNGRDLADFKDPNGKRMFSAFADVVKEAGSGFMEYSWPKPGSDQPVRKISYVKGYQPWHWIVGSGVYTDDVEKVVHKNALIAATVVLITLIAVAGVSVLIARGIVRPLAQMTNAMRRLAAGEVTIAVPGVGLRNELGDMAGAMQVFKENAADRLRLEAEQVELKQRAEAARKQAISSLAERFETDVGAVTTTLAASAKQMQGTSQSMAATAEETSRQASAVAAASEQASSNVQTVAAAAEELAVTTREIARKSASRVRLPRVRASKLSRRVAGWRDSPKLPSASARS